MELRDETGWRRDGDVLNIDWAGSTWSLACDDGRMGLRRASGKGLFLALSGLAARGRREDGCFAASNRVSLEIIHARVLASFTPEGWNGLTVRAAWGPCRDGRGIDLEVQAVASTVGELRRLEVLIESRPTGDRGASGGLLTVEPRDLAAAGASYDGREPTEALQRLSTLAIPRPDGVRFPPTAWPASRMDMDAPGAYLEMVHPDDVSRRIREEAGEAVSVRCALFGYDLERGVVLRGRLRGIQLPQGAPTDAQIDEEHLRFLTEPPPLRTD